ncbi:flagellar motor switch protein FliG [Erythrobacter sp. LQ02-29]|uniref:flagellar motor switch protein FliG n=1 Tax=Erythrobacter sp. LQ02-29 TaxID=2920384 RepID=UPI001F4E00DD|nr:FliG C-terminal domain-containing protein [Erythrobacter sp. LQ02-29]MCP9221254.1 flagellar motor switch protein FliG [Erythrobacter sp. LQ02-29]
MSYPLPASDFDRAAIIVMLFNEDEAAAILSRLEPEELHRLGQAMCALGEVDAPGIASALDRFIVEAARETLPVKDRPTQVRELMSRAVGSDKAGHLMDRIAPNQVNRSLEIARWLAPQSLLTLIEDEPPQVIAVLLLLLDSDSAASLLAQLPMDKQPLIVERVARLGKVPTQAIVMLDAMLTRRISERFGQTPLSMGGAREAAELINRAEGNIEKLVMPSINSRDADLAREIEAELFTFDMLLKLDAMSIGRLLREVENDVLIDALKGLDEDDREPIFAAMSSRAADGVRDEIELRGRIRKADMMTAQRSIIATARQLAESGEIALGQSDGEYV